MHVIYLHGFCSSALSFKAQLVKEYVEDREEHSIFLVDLPHVPAQAMYIVEAHIRTLGDEPWSLVGSSLGGYYATYLAEKYNKKAVLINPAVRSYSLLEPLLGDNTNYHSQQTFELTVEHLEQLKVLYAATLKAPKNLLLLTKTGDEVLNFQDGVDYYEGATQVVIQGGDHGFDDYADYLDVTFKHLME